MKLQIYSPYGCPCSYSAKKEFGIFDPDVIQVHDHEKEHYKRLNEMSTFPQIFILVNDKRIKIGGYDDTIIFINKIRNNENLNNENINCEDECVINNFFKEKFANEMQLSAEFRERVYNDQVPWLSKNGI
jgi:glutaredoxin